MGDDLSTIAPALAWAAGQLRMASSTPRLDSELLLAHVLGWSRAGVLAEGRHPLDAGQQAAFHDLIVRRTGLEPVAYLTGHKEFYGLDLIVDRRVLIPRPETELLVELALRHARRLSSRPLLLADIGTGSGCIAVVMAAHLPEALIVATDLSPGALAVARENLERHGVSKRVRLVGGDLLEPLDAPVDLLVSNPPYTVLSAIDEGVRRHEPRQALDGGQDGLDLYRRLLAQAPARLRLDGAALLEIGATQGAAVMAIARAHFPAAQIRVHQDLAGLDRVVEISSGATDSG
jgi:release factor glutamine methyltransferase